MEKEEHKVSVKSYSTAYSNTKSVDKVKDKDTEELEASLSLLKAIAFTLLKLIEEGKNKKNYSEIVKSQINSVYNSKNIPNISISDYLVRIKKYAQLEDSSLVFSLILIDRFLKTKSIVITELNVHRILFSSIMISIKYNEDKYYSNKYYAKVGGINLTQLNLLEFDFVCSLEFNIMVEYKLFEKYYRNLIAISMDIPKETENA